MQSMWRRALDGSLALETKNGMFRGDVARPFTQFNRIQEEISDIKRDEKDQ